jgi:tetratricopeptide (TPR) repeat protein
MPVRHFLYTILLFWTPLVGALQIESEVVTKVKKDTSSETTLQPGEHLELEPGETALAIPLNGIPVMILYPQSHTTKIQLSSVDFKSYSEKTLSQMINQQSNEILTGIRKAETAISQRNYTQAASLLSPLRQKFPNISSILFISASVEFLLKNKSSAIEYLQKGLAIDPNDSAANKLLAELQGVAK